MPDILYISHDKKEMRVFSIEEQKQLVEYLLNDMDLYKFGVLLSLSTGLRIGELCGLEWNDISEDRISVNALYSAYIERMARGPKYTLGNQKQKHLYARYLSRLFLNQ